VDAATLEARAAWLKMLDSLSDKPVMSWIKQLAVRRADEQSVVVDTLPGSRELRGFLDDRRLEQLGNLLGSILGRPIRISLETSGNPASIPMHEPDANRTRASLSQVRPPKPGTPAPGTAGNSGVPGVVVNPVTEKPGERVDYSRAMNLPLVRQVFEVFEATLINAHPEIPAGPPPATTDPENPNAGHDPPPHESSSKTTAPEASENDALGDEERTMG
jgi:hypothetical protein